jgi:hypothetical protein
MVRKGQLGAWKVDSFIEWMKRPGYGYAAARVLDMFFKKKLLRAADVATLATAISQCKQVTQEHEIAEYVRLFKHVVTTGTQRTPDIRDQFVLGLCRYAHASEKASRYALSAFSTKGQLQRVGTEAYCAIQPLPQSREHEYSHVRAYGTLLLQVTARIHLNGRPNLGLEWVRVNALEKTHACQGIFLELRSLISTASLFSPGELNKASGAPTRDDVANLVSLLSDPRYGVVAGQAIAHALRCAIPAYKQPGNGEVEDLLTRLGRSRTATAVRRGLAPRDSLPSLDLLLDHQVSEEPASLVFTNENIMHIILEEGSGLIPDPLNATREEMKAMIGLCFMTARVVFYDYTYDDAGPESEPYFISEQSIMTPIGDFIKGIARKQRDQVFKETGETESDGLTTLYDKGGDKIPDDLLLGDLFNFGIPLRSLIDDDDPDDDGLVHLVLSIAFMNRKEAKVTYIEPLVARARKPPNTSWKARTSFSEWAAPFIATYEPSQGVIKAVAMEMRMMMSNPLIGLFDGTYDVIYAHPTMFREEERVSAAFLLQLQPRQRLRVWREMYWPLKHSGRFRYPSDSLCSIHAARFLDAIKPYLVRDTPGTWELPPGDDSLTGGGSPGGERAKCHLHEIGRIAGQVVLCGCGLPAGAHIDVRVIRDPTFWRGFTSVVTHLAFASWFSEDELSRLIETRHSWYPCDAYRPSREFQN